METRKVTFELVDGVVQCEYGEKETKNPTALVCDLIIAEVETIMTISHKSVVSYMTKIYNRELKKITPKLSDKFTLVSDKKRDIKYYPKNDESNNNT